MTFSYTSVEPSTRGESPEERPPRLLFTLLHKTLINKPASHLARTARSLEDVPLILLERGGGDVQKALQSSDERSAALSFGRRVPASVRARGNGQDGGVAVVHRVRMISLIGAGCHHADFGIDCCGSGVSCCPEE